MPSPHTTDTFIAKAKKVHNNKYAYTKVEYVNAKHLVTITCKAHGDFSQNPGNHLFGSGCPKCANETTGKNQTHLAEVFVARCIKIHKGFYRYPNLKYKGQNFKIEIECPLHGSFTQSARNHITGHGCPKCKAINTSRLKVITHEEFIMRANKVHANFFKYPAIYESGHKFLDIECPDHGVFKQMPYSHLAGHGCAACVGSQSQMEFRVAEMLGRHCEVIHGSRQIIKPFQLDIYIPEKRLAIEINGNYWHSEIHKSPKYHYNKAKKCAEKKIRLLQFWESDLLHKAPIVSSILCNALGKSRTIYARKTEIKEVPVKEARKFYDRTHLQGFAAASLYYGLYFEGLLVACMSFGKPRFDKNYEWELVRFSSELRTSVVGGASKLFSFFTRVSNPANVLSYADLMISKGDIYRTLGFKKLRTSPPSFTWQKREIIISRYTAQRHKLASMLGKDYDSNLSSAANMRAAGFVKVHDAGNLVFIYQR